MKTITVYTLLLLFLLLKLEQNIALKLLVYIVLQYVQLACLGYSFPSALAITNLIFALLAKPHYKHSVSKETELTNFLIKCKLRVQCQQMQTPDLLSILSSQLINKLYIVADMQVSRVLLTNITLGIPLPLYVSLFSTLRKSDVLLFSGENNIKALHL